MSEKTFTSETMITYVTGNIFDSPAQAIVNTVNTQGVMGKGLALQFKEAYPKNYELYRKACKRGEVVTGRMFITEEEGGLLGRPRIIVNFPTKRAWRDPSEYSYIEEGLDDLSREIAARRITSIAMPQLGTNNGGLSWPVVKKMMEDALGGLDCDVTIFEPGSAQVERTRAEKVRLTPVRAMLLRVLADMEAEMEPVSEFAAEKVCYFLQRMGGADVFKLSFEKGIYGPYSGKARHILHQLNGSYVMGMTTMSLHPFDEIWLTPDAAAAADMFLQTAEPRFRELTERVMALLSGFYMNYLLELLATVDFIVSHNDTRAMTDDEIVEAVSFSLGDWSWRKSRLFNDGGHIRLALGRLREFGLVSGPTSKATRQVETA